MGARFFKLLPVLLWACGSPALSSPEPALQIDQTILEAHAQLVEAGWMPAPTQTPSERERRWAGVTLESLPSCSGSGSGGVPLASGAASAGAPAGASVDASGAAAIPEQTKNQLRTFE